MKVLTKHAHKIATDAMMTTVITMVKMMTTTTITTTTGTRKEKKHGNTNHQKHEHEHGSESWSEVDEHNEHDDDQMSIHVVYRALTCHEEPWRRRMRSVCTPTAGGT